MALLTEEVEGCAGPAERGQEDRWMMGETRRWAKEGEE